MQETAVGPILSCVAGPRNLERARSPGEGAGVEYGWNRNSGRYLGICEASCFERDSRESHFALTEPRPGSEVCWLELQFRHQQFYKNADRALC